MKILQLMTAASLAIAVAATPAAAQHTRTTVTKVHGPLKLLPHHKRKYCRTTTVHHHRTKKCWYH